MFWFKGEFEKNNNFYKKVKKKIRNKTIKLKLESIILIWMMKLKIIKFLQNDQEEKIEIRRMRIELKNIVFDKLGLKNETENK